MRDAALGGSVRATLVLLLLLPLAAAQPEVPLVEVTAEDPPLVRPLQGTVTANVTVRASCLLADGARGVQLTYSIPEKPAWASVVVSPTSDVADPQTCEAGYVTRSATLTITASHEAPAFTPTPVTFLAQAGPEGRREEGRTQVNVTADYFSILDTQIPETSKVVAPGASTQLAFKVTNLGNAATRVTFTVEGVTGDLRVETPAPVVLQSKQQGGSQTSEEVAIVVHAPEGGAFVNKVGTFTLLAQAEHAGEPPRKGDAARASLIVTVKSGGNDAPLPALVPLAALALAALRRRA